MTGGASTIVEFKWSVRRRRKFSEIQAPKYHFLVENSLKRSQNTTKHHKNTKNPEKSASGGGQINNFTPPCFRSAINKGDKVIKGGKVIINSTDTMKQIGSDDGRTQDRESFINREEDADLPELPCFHTAV